MFVNLGFFWAPKKNIPVESTPEIFGQVSRRGSKAEEVS